MSQITKRIEKIREEMKHREVSFLLITFKENIGYCSSFWPTEEGDAIGLIGENIAYMFTDGRYRGAKYDPAFEMVIWSGDDKLKEIEKRLPAKPIVHFEKSIRYAQLSRLEEKLEDIIFKPGPAIFETIRQVKSSEEIELIQQAAHITDQAFEHICSFICAGMSEIDVATELNHFLRKKSGCDELSFDTIVASGPNGGTPHATPSDRVIQAGEFVTLDFGATYKHYHADMTRTILLEGGEPNLELYHVYEIVLKAQRECRKTAKPGMTGQEIDAVPRKIIEDAGYGDKFEHGTGHGVGLQIHEAPTVSKSEQCNVPLKAGTIFTVEPGIYIQDVGGIRIEDLCVMTEDGCLALSKSPKELIRL